MRRTTGIIDAAALLVIAVAGWGGLVEFLGPRFDFDIATTRKAWVWTQSHWTLGLAPAVVGMVGGLLILLGGRVAVQRLGAALALIAGAWFVIGPTVEPLWQHGGITTSGSDGVTQSRTIRVLEGVGYHYGTGTALMLLGAFVLGLLATVTIVYAEPPAEAPASDAEATRVRTPAPV
jgi:hypothetical protein